VADSLLRFQQAGLEWPAAAALDDATLQAKLFPAAPAVSSAQRPVPDWDHVHREVRRASVTFMLLWHEYKTAHPAGFQYSWFCHQYRAWAGNLDVVSGEEHRAGEKLFVDYARPNAQGHSPLSDHQLRLGGGR
jgi:transposase